MKSILVIGLGCFGSYLSRNLLSLGNEVMVVDKDEERVKPLLPYAVSAQIGDCTDPDVMETLGIRNFDTCFVCIGNDFQSSLEITSLLKEMGAKYVVSKAGRDVHEKFLLKNGADEVMFPERDIAEKNSMRFSTSNVFDYIELTKDLSIYEIPIIESWIGKSIGDIDIRQKFNLNILAVKQGGLIAALPGASHMFIEGEHIMVLGKADDVNRILKKI